MKKIYVKSGGAGTEIVRQWNSLTLKLQHWKVMDTESAASECMLNS